MVLVVLIEVGDERPGIDDDAYSSPLRRFSSRISSKISSTRTERSPRPLRPDAAPPEDAPTADAQMHLDRLAG
ncbi:MAG: hypothetical protein U0V56_08260 [Actinomycetota bacterium]